VIVRKTKGAQKKKLIHDLSIAGWMLSPVPEVMKDVDSSHDGYHCNAVEQSLKQWLHYENFVSILLLMSLITTD
jgi:hypothetical protein